MVTSRPQTSPTGWWIAGLLEKHSTPGRAPFWNNYRLIKADNWRSAFKKATILGECNAKAGNEAFSDSQMFIGVSDLVPIYEQFEDGSEVLWEELEGDDSNADGIPLHILTESSLEAIYGESVEPPAPENLP